KSLVCNSFAFGKSVHNNSFRMYKSRTHQFIRRLHFPAHKFIRTFQKSCCSNSALLPPSCLCGRGSLGSSFLLLLNLTKRIEVCLPTEHDQLTFSEAVPHLFAVY